LELVTLHTAPHIDGNKSRPYLEIFDDVTGALIWTSKEKTKARQMKFIDNWADSKTHFLCNSP
jgi:hypothetical protein